MVRAHGLGRNGHAHFSPSSSAGWMNCDGFVLANAGKPDGGGYDAAYGTVAHEIAAVWLNAIRDQGKKIAEYVPRRFLDWPTTEQGHKIIVDADMLHHIRCYIDYCEEVEILGDVFIEQRLDYSEFMPIQKQGGTADHFVCSPGLLIITDLKMGTGVRVYVTRNSQAMLYALAVYLEWNWVYSFKRIRLRICQPRLDVFEEWECSVEELLAFAEEARVRAARGWKADAKRSPSPKACQWCADIGCVARSKLLEDLTDDVFDAAEEMGDESPTYDQETLTDHAMAPLFGPPKEPSFIQNMETAVLAWRYRHRKMFQKWFSDIGEELLRRAQAGIHVPGYKVAQGRRSFSWIDPEDAAFELSLGGMKEADIFETEVTSVSKARKALRALGMSPEEVRQVLNEAIVRTTPGKPTLVLENDERPDLEDTVDDTFTEDDL